MGASWFDRDFSRFDHIKDMLLEISKDDKRVIGMLNFFHFQVLLKVIMYVDTPDTEIAYHQFLSFHLPGRTLSLVDILTIPTMPRSVLPIIRAKLTVTVDETESGGVASNGSHTLMSSAHIGLAREVLLRCWISQ